jgi:hypothetical protein
MTVIHNYILLYIGPPVCPNPFRASSAKIHLVPHLLKSIPRPFPLKSSPLPFPLKSPRPFLLKSPYPFCPNKFQRPSQKVIPPPHPYPHPRAAAVGTSVTTRQQQRMWVPPAIAPYPSPSIIVLIMRIYLRRSDGSLVHMNPNSQILCKP